MTAQSRNTLKGYFQRGLRPTQSQYGDLIDSFALVSAAADFLPLTGGIMTGAIQLPGVPTSALAAATKGYVDATVSAGVVVGGSNGQVQYNNAGALGGFTVSGDAASLATTGVLTLANTAVSAGTYTLSTVTVDSKGRLTSASNGSALTSGTAQATTSGTQFDFTGIPSSVKSIRVMLSGVSLSGSDNVLIQIGDAGGIETTGYNSTSEYAAAGVASTSGFIIKFNSAGEATSGMMEINQINTDSWVASGVFRPNTGTGTGGCAIGNKTLSATLDRVRITVTGANTFDAGTVNIIYE